MSLFTEPGLKLNFFDVNGRNAILLEPIHYGLSSGGVIIIPEGFMSDGASVPRFFWFFLPPWGSKASKAAIVHDFLLKQTPQGYSTRKEADDEFYIALKALGIHTVPAYVSWLGVRSWSIIKCQLVTRVLSLMGQKKIARKLP